MNLECFLVKNQNNHKCNHIVNLIITCKMISSGGRRHLCKKRLCELSTYFHSNV